MWLLKGRGGNVGEIISGGFSQEVMGVGFCRRLLFLSIYSLHIDVSFFVDNERFKGLFPLKSPTHFVPSVEIMVP